MLEVEFQEWLKSRGAKTQAGLNSRIYAVKTIEKSRSTWFSSCRSGCSLPGGWICAIAAADQRDSP
jgi:hypothetical protein